MRSQKDTISTYQRLSKSNHPGRVHLHCMTRDRPVFHPCRYLGWIAGSADPSYFFESNYTEARPGYISGYLFSVKGVEGTYNMGRLSDKQVFIGMFVPDNCPV